MKTDQAPKFYLVTSDPRKAPSWAQPLHAPHWIDRRNLTCIEWTKTHYYQKLIDLVFQIVDLEWSMDSELSRLWLGIEAPPTNVRSSTYAGNSVADLVALNGILRQALYQRYFLQHGIEYVDWLHVLTTGQLCKALTGNGKADKATRVGHMLTKTGHIAEPGKKLDDLADAYGVSLCLEDMAKRWKPAKPV